MVTYENNNEERQEGAVCKKAGLCPDQQNAENNVYFRGRPRIRG